MFSQLRKAYDKSWRLDNFLKNSLDNSEIGFGEYLT
jgi:hypothetical protein